LSNKLTPKQQAFVYAYLEDFNATRAAQKAGYKGNLVTLASVGYENLRKPKIRKAINTLLADNAVGVPEIIQHLSKLARGSYSDFISKDNEGFIIIDLYKAETLGVLDLVERLDIIDYEDKDGIRRQRVVLKLYSRQKAVELLAKAYGLFKTPARNNTGQQLSSGKPKPEGIGAFAGVGTSIKRLLKQNYESEHAAHAYWMAVACGFIPQPPLPSRASLSHPDADPYRDIEIGELNRTLLDVSLWEIDRFGVDLEKAYADALKYGCVEGTYEEYQTNLKTEPASPTHPDPETSTTDLDEERYVDGVSRW